MSAVLESIPPLPLYTQAKLPNIKKLFTPDPGYILCDTDLDRADLQVVVWEAGDEQLKSDLRMGLDMHCANAMDIWNVPGIPRDELVESHPNYKERRGQIGEKLRRRAKAGVHATNYYCQPRTLAKALGTIVHEAEQFQTRWFAAHPGIKDWHNRIEHQLTLDRTVWNKFGFRIQFFDRIETVLPQALAWIPQSTVGLVTNYGWLNIWEQVPEVEVLLQVHDSLVWQTPYDLLPSVKPRVKKALEITIPYEDPLIIPVGIKTSRRSWGDVKDDTWV